jgi:hypothetical protein
VERRARISIKIEGRREKKRENRNRKKKGGMSPSNPSILAPSPAGR